MRIELKGLSNYVVEPQFTEYATPRLETLSHFSDRLRECRVVITPQRGRYTVEITCDLDGLVLRSETVNNDLLTGFDEAFDKVERRITRHKSKLVRKQKQGPHRGLEQVSAAESMEPEVELEFEATDADEALREFDIVRTKSHALKPMSPQEAVLQMEMVGHDFYVFLLDEHGRVGVVYRRKNGGYGLIEPVIGEGEEEE